VKYHRRSNQHRQEGETPPYHRPTHLDPHRGLGRPLPLSHPPLPSVTPLIPNPNTNTTTLPSPIPQTNPIPIPITIPITTQPRHKPKPMPPLHPPIRPQRRPPQPPPRVREPGRVEPRHAAPRVAERHEEEALQRDEEGVSWLWGGDP
jgi:hypothetical protein